MISPEVTTKLNTTFANGVKKFKSGAKETEEILKTAKAYAGQPAAETELKTVSAADILAQLPNVKMKTPRPVSPAVIENGKVLKTADNPNLNNNK